MAWGGIGLGRVEWVGMEWSGMQQDGVGWVEWGDIP